LSSFIASVCGARLVARRPRAFSLPPAAVRESVPGAHHFAPDPPCRAARAEFFFILCGFGGAHPAHGPEGHPHFQSANGHGTAPRSRIIAPVRALSRTRRAWFAHHCAPGAL